MENRTSEIQRKTNETEISLSLNLDGTGEQNNIETDIGFFSHMMELLSRHSLCDITLSAKGDTDVDFHHTVEDTGLVLGEAVLQALGDKKGIKRYGAASIPMDEALAQTSVDLSGRPYLVFSSDIKNEKVGDFDTELCKDFFQAVATAGKMNVNIDVKGGENTHHIIEVIFKSFARALREAVSMDDREKNVPSTKGVL